jgi:hypothetical protein
MMRNMGGSHGCARQAVRLDLDFPAQVPGHLFEGLDEVIADARALGTRSALRSSPDMSALTFQFDLPAAAIAPRSSVPQRHC